MFEGKVDEDCLFSMYRVSARFKIAKSAALDAKVGIHAYAHFGASGSVNGFSCVKEDARNVRAGWLTKQGEWLVRAANLLIC